jgi:hypothetical protein
LSGTGVINVLTGKNIPSELLDTMILFISKEDSL